MKKFMEKAEGFTLVELIVVIAILGILAGVAVPAYTGYLTKAKEAADTQVVSAVNTAFAAALAENGLDKDDVSAATYTEGSGTTAGSVAVTMATGVSVDAATVQGDFATYFGGNIGALDYYTSLTYSTTTGTFSGVTE